MTWWRGNNEENRYLNMERDFYQQTETGKNDSRFGGDIFECIFINENIRVFYSNPYEGCPFESN